VTAYADPNPETVHDETSFLAFVAQLAADRRLACQLQSGPYDAPRGWQNDTIEAFLESALAWAEASRFGRTQGLPEDSNVWRRLAVFLYCGKIYE
jgi:hypothetical protein